MDNNLNKKGEHLVNAVHIFSHPRILISTCWLLTKAW